MLDTEAMRGGYYHPSDVATSDEDSYITYLGRIYDVFKAQEYRISPFELESVRPGDHPHRFRLDVTEFWEEDFSW